MIATPSLSSGARRLAALIGLVVGGGVIAVGLVYQNSQIQDARLAVAAIAAETAATLDGAAIAALHSQRDQSSPVYRQLQRQLRMAKERHSLRLPIAVVRQLNADTAMYVLSSGQHNTMGETLPMSPELAEVFAGQGRVATGLYMGHHGWQIDGLAPIRGPDGTVAVLVVETRANYLILSRTRLYLYGLLSGVIASGLTLAAARRSLFRAAARWVFSSLEARIGLSGAVVVLLAVTVVIVLDHRASEAELRQHTGEFLEAVVRLGAPRIDPGLHQRVATTLSASAPEFDELRSVLRDIQTHANLDAPLYTLIRDGDHTRFVGMTNETPFVGEPYELRPFALFTLETGVPTWEGPYIDAHGTWISACAPIRDANGEVIGLLQADEEFSGVMDDLWNRTLERMLFGLLGISLSFLSSVLLARHIARPIVAVAEAANRIERGDLSATVPEVGQDEVGQLTRSINRMVKGLREREQLRQLFGKYLSPHLADTLLSREQVTLSGELREVTVLTTDIRGFTQFSSQRGAPDVVTLLNSYFEILVEIVLRHGGTVDKFMGDALLCWFGAPLPLPDHRARAMAAALEIQERLARWNLQRLTDGEDPLPTGIGVAAGQVVVGNIGSSQRLEYTAIGDAVNLSSRLCALADGGEIVVTDDVYQARPDPRFSPEKQANVRGIQTPVAVRTAVWRGTGQAAMHTPRG